MNHVEPSQLGAGLASSTVPPGPISWPPGVRAAACLTFDMDAKTERLLPGARLLGRLSGREHLPRYAIGLTVIIAGALIFAGASKVFALLVSFSAFGFILSYPPTRRCWPRTRCGASLRIWRPCRWAGWSGRPRSLPPCTIWPPRVHGLRRGALAERRGGDLMLSRVALITGAAQGLGHATALRLAADGFMVAVNDLTDDGRLSDLAERTGGLACAADISDPVAGAEMVAAVASRVGPVQVLVANAAAMAMSPGLGRELGPQGILTNAIAASFIDTSQLQVDADDAGLSLDEMRRVYSEQIPVRRLASPDDIAAAVAFLAGPGSSAVVGQILQPAGA